MSDLCSPISTDPVHQHYNGQDMVGMSQEDMDEQDREIAAEAQAPQALDVRAILVRALLLEQLMEEHLLSDEALSVVRDVRAAVAEIERLRARHDEEADDNATHLREAEGERDAALKRAEEAEARL